MKRLTFRHLVLLLTLTISATSFADFSVPEELEVKVSGKTIKGTYGDPEVLKIQVAYAVANPGSYSGLPPEGFIYRKNEDMDAGFEIVAWSSNGKKEAILKAARKELEKTVFNQSSDSEKPMGLAYAPKTQIDFKSKDGEFFAEKKEVPVSPLTVNASFGEILPLNKVRSLLGK